MEKITFSEMSFPLKCKFLLATVGGVGLLPKAPGTFGSFVAMSILFVPFEIRVYILPVLVIICSIIFMVVIPEIDSIFSHDASLIVLDELIGMWVLYSFFFIPVSIYWYIIGFGLFRLFDIWKPFPINLINNQKTVFSILADDIVAAIFATVTVYLFYNTSLVLPFLLYL